MLRLLWAVLRLAGVVGFLCNLAVVGWRELGPRKPQPNPLRRELAEALLPRLVADLRGQRTNAAAAVLLHFAGDTTDYLSDRLRQLLGESGVLELTVPTLDETLQRRLNLPVTSPANLDAAVARARGLGAPAVLFGTVKQFDGTPEGGRLVLEVTLADIGTKGGLFQRTYEQEWQPTTPTPALADAPIARAPLVSRLLGWALLVLLLPVFSFGFLRSTVRRKTNRANLGVLVLYTAVAAGLAALLVVTPTGAGPALLLALLTALALAYHLWIMTVALRLEEN